MRLVWTMTRVAVTRDLDDIGAAVGDALAHLELEPIIRGRLVALKPNETWASEDDRTGVTQPDTLRAVIRAVRELGPSHIVVTGGAGAAETDEVFEVAGLMDVVREEGVEFFDHNRGPFQEVDLDYSGSGVEGPQQGVMVNPRVLEYETLITLNQLKLHENATVTMAMKNIAMSYPAADYYGHPRSTEKHDHGFFDDIHAFIAAMIRRFPIDLAVTVGHPAMVATGPLGGHAVETGQVVASRDAIAADVVGARLLGFTTDAVRHLWMAGRMRLGETDLDAMEFPALSLRQAIGDFTESVYGERLTFEHE